MAKSDFDLNEEEYDVVYEDKKKDLVNKFKKKSKETSKNFDTSSIDDTSELGDFANVSVVSDDKPKEDILDKLFKTIKNTNIRTLIVIFGVILVSFVIFLVVVVSIGRINKSYTSDIIIPDVLYVGEASGVSVTTRYTGDTPPKRDITQTVSTFKVSNSSIVAPIEENAIGSQIINALIPKQEGKATIEVTSNLNGRVLKSLKKEVTVCPTFDSSLWLVNNISIPVNGSYQLKMDAIPEECAKDITYSSSNDKIAMIDENAKITAFSTGVTSIIVKSGERSFNINVEVTDYKIGIQDIKFNDSEIQLSPGEKYRLGINYMPLNTTSFPVSLISRDDRIVKVDEYGVITAIEPGETTVRLSSSSFEKDAVVTVVVSDEKSSNSSLNSFEINKASFNMVQGDVERISLLLNPNNINKDVIKYKSSDNNIAYVTNDGFIYAKGQGKAIIEIYTETGLKKQVKVSVRKLRTPVISSSDHIVSDNWHNKAYILNFPLLEKATMYYIGSEQEGTTNNKIVVNQDGINNYYVRACSRICNEICNKKDENNKNEEKNECKLECAPNPFICSDPANYISKLDVTKPVIKSVDLGSDGAANSFQISIEDKTSLVGRWCVSKKASFVNCSWRSINPEMNPVVSFNATEKGMYYAYASDVAGNISSPYKFEVE